MTLSGAGGDATVKSRLSKKLSQAGWKNAVDVTSALWEKNSSTLRTVYGPPHQIAECMQKMADDAGIEVMKWSASKTPTVTEDVLQTADPWARWSGTKPDAPSTSKQKQDDPTKFQNLRLLSKVASGGQDLPVKTAAELARTDSPGVALVHSSNLQATLEQLEVSKGPCVLITQRGQGASCKLEGVVSAQILVCSVLTSQKRVMTVDVIVMPPSVSFDIKQPAVPVTIPRAENYETILDGHEDQVEKGFFSSLARRCSLVE
eukprot:5220502-Amphidinium_carterae.1